jgi:hypothetical protein
MLFVTKSQDGAIERLTIGDGEDFGSLLAAVVPVANGCPAVPAPADGPAAFDPAFLLVEHRWAAPLLTQSPRPAAR